MTIEENEDSAVRGLLGTAFADPEPPLRDLASGSIARGDAVRHRNRMVAAGGATLSVVAVIGTFAVVTGAAPAGRAHQDPADQVTSATSSSTAVSPKGFLGFGPEIGSVDKLQDVQNRLSGLLQPLLPGGVTASRQPSGRTPGMVTVPAAVLTTATGTTTANMWVGMASAKETDAIIREVACPQGSTGSKGGTCTTRTVDGGTVYLDEYAATATETVRRQTLPADVVKAGTSNTIVSRTLSMMFVPTDRTKYAFSLTESTATAKVQYADHEPSDYMTGGIWPPPSLPDNTWAYDPSGPAMSADDLMGMLGRPGLKNLEYLLDPRTAVSQDTQTRLSATEAQIVAAAEAALPSAVKVSVDVSLMQPEIMLTGPSGRNQLQWEAVPQTTQYKQQVFGLCPPNATCTKRAVPGGTLEVYTQKPTDSKLTALSDTPSVYNYWFVPDDLSKPVLAMTLETSADQTRLPGRSETDPGQTYSVNKGPYAPAQVSADQFLAAAQSGRLATAISKTASLLATFR
ncbi:hypothetical protein [Catenulispora rubra]|uniref:hypothetical protein n=1 Tax=Catenulispora rubra TaxID=280293 RepID=UPI0018925D57|nr:hypothetical protein [Catenulispora rubra]